MFPNGNEIMYRYAQTREKELRDDATNSRGPASEAQLVRRRLVMVLGLGLMALTVAALVAVGWWML